MDAPSPILAHLTELAAAGLPCPANRDLAVALRVGRSSIVRGLDHLEDHGLIERRGSGWRRTVTIVATGARTATPRRQAPRKPPLIVPPCAVCGDPVVMKSGKFPRSCAKPSCRASVRSLAYGGTVAAEDWPTVGDEIAADFAPHELRLRRTITRLPGLPPTRSYGVSTAYEVLG